MSKSKIFPYLEVLFAVIVWGASFIATKIGVKEASPITVVWLRFGMGVIILGIAVAARSSTYHRRVDPLRASESGKSTLSEES